MERLEVTAYGSTRDDLFVDAHRIAARYFGDRPHHIEHDPRRPIVVDVQERSITGDMVVFVAHVYFVEEQP